jgi:dienelactone hydrolase
MSLRNIVIFATLVTAIFATPCFAQPSATCRAHGQAALEAWSQGRYDSVGKDFAPSIASMVSPERLKTGWTQLVAIGGKFEKVGDLQPRSLSGNDVMAAEMTFSGLSMTAVVACDAHDRITTFRVIPSSALSAAEPQAETLDPSLGKSRSLQVPSPLGPLQGTLVLPKGAGPFPVVLLVAGSGPYDRDESIGPNKPFRDLAEGLAAAGIASFRYDKRTYVYGSGMNSKNFTVDEEVTDDALAAAHLLAAQPQIDSRRIFVLGHSLGAMMAPRIGQRDPQLAGLILLAAPARALLDVSAQQVRDLGTQQGMSAAKISEQEQGIAAEQKLLAQANSAHPAHGEFVGMPNSYWQSLNDYRQVDVAKHLSMPMLLLQGAADFQVSPTNDFAGWQAALKNSPRTTFHLYPGLSHLFMPAGNPPSMADYAKQSRVDPRVIGDITQWVKAQPPSA